MGREGFHAKNPPCNPKVAPSRRSSSYGGQATDPFLSAEALA
jgi:hypothetical protein